MDILIHIGRKLSNNNDNNKNNNFAKYGKIHLNKLSHYIEEF